MAIKLELSQRQLGSVVYCLQQLPKVNTNNRDTKVAKSVLSELALKFEKKNLEQSYKEHNLFTKKKVKKINFTLKMVEAHFLEMYAQMMETFPLNEYDRNVLLYLKNNLNQKLA